MRIVIDIEANGLTNPDKIWVVVCKDIDTNSYHIFRHLTTDASERKRFLDFTKSVQYWIGHNLLGYDLRVLSRLLGITVEARAGSCCDTLVIGRMADYSRKGGLSLESYGDEFGFAKGIPLEDGTVLESKHFTQAFYMQYSKDLENYCIRDVDITHKVYLKYLKYINDPSQQKAITLEQEFEVICQELTDKGFSFNTLKAKELLLKVEKELSVIDEEFKETFVPKLRLVREVTPKATKHGTISLSSIPRAARHLIPDLTVGAPFSYCVWVDFNPSSHSQIIRLLNDAGWRPIDKTATHIDVEREINKLKYQHKTPELDTKLKELYSKLEGLQKTGWQVNEKNLETLPPSAPPPAKLITKRILLEARRRTLTEWLELVDSSGRIHGRFYGIGAWTHRMAHRNPNTANIPNAVRVSDGLPNPYGKELRSLWQAPRNRLLVGVDAEAIQLRVFAHLINDPALTDAIVNGKKSEGTDPHSLNKKYFGSFCKTRNAAKHSLYAIFFGGGAGKIAEIMGCTRDEAQQAIESLIDKYPGLRRLQNEVFPTDAKRGWFIGLDGRKVRIPGDTVGNRKHLCMSGYLQNGEAIIMKMATLRFAPLLPEGCFLVNFVHDEWQTEVPNNMEIALRVASLQADSLRVVGEELKLNCPMAGSYWSDEFNDYTIDKNWSKTH